MIVQSMNQNELLREVLQDLPQVKKKSLYDVAKLRREAIRLKPNPARQWVNYRSARKNEWMVLLYYRFYAFNTLCFVKYLNTHGLNILFVDKFLSHYSAHFIERYNERFLKKTDMDKLDIFREYIKRNSVSSMGKLVYDEGDYAWGYTKLDDGIAITTLEKIDGQWIVDYKTFITEDMVRADQVGKIDEIKKMIDSYKRNPILFEEIYTKGLN